MIRWAPLFLQRWWAASSSTSRIDDFSRECLAPIVDTSISGRRVARELDQLIA